MRIHQTMLFIYYLYLHLYSELESKSPPLSTVFLTILGKWNSPHCVMGCSSQSVLWLYTGIYYYNFFLTKVVYNPGSCCILHTS